VVFDSVSGQSVAIGRVRLSVYLTVAFDPFDLLTLDVVLCMDHDHSSLGTESKIKG